MTKETKNVPEFIYVDVPNYFLYTLKYLEE